VMTDDDDRRQRTKRHWPPTPHCVGRPVIKLVHAERTLFQRERIILFHACMNGSSSASDAVLQHAMSTSRGAGKTVYDKVLVTNDILVALMFNRPVFQVSDTILYGRLTCAQKGWPA